MARYDTPTLAGFTFAASYGEDDMWDVGISYEGEARGFQVAAAIAYTQSTDANGLEGECCELDNSVIVGSVALLHEPSCLNALVAADQQSFDESVEDADGIFRTPADAKCIYKLGWIANWSALGPTGFYGEHGYFGDFATAGANGDQVASLAANGFCSTPGNCRVTGSDVDVWSLGVVQTIDAAEMQMYIGYRHYEADFDLADTNGSQLAAEGLQNFQTVITGAIISF